MRLGFLEEQKALGHAMIIVEVIFKGGCVIAKLLLLVTPTSSDSNETPQMSINENKPLYQSNR